MSLSLSGALILALLGVGTQLEVLGPLDGFHALGLAQHTQTAVAKTVLIPPRANLPQTGSRTSVHCLFPPSGQVRLQIRINIDTPACTTVSNCVLPLGQGFLSHTRALHLEHSNLSTILRHETPNEGSRPAYLLLWQFNSRKL